MVVAFGVLSAARRRDVTGEAEGVALAGSGPQPTGERQRLFGETSGLIDPPGPEIGRPRAQQNERRPVVNLTNAELLDGIRDQWERLVSPAAESVGGAEGSGKEWCPDDEMPRAAEVWPRSRIRVACGRSARRRWARPSASNPTSRVKG